MVLGCASSRTAQHRYDDPRFSPDARKAVHAATEAVLDPGRPRPNFDQVFRYDVSQTNDGWLVIISRIDGFKFGAPQFVPGGHTGVTLDPSFQVKRIYPGA